MLVKVAIDLALDRLFTYEVPVELCQEVKVGQLLRMPFGHREARGFALEVMGTGNGEWGMGNGEWGMGNGERGTGKNVEALNSQPSTLNSTRSTCSTRLNPKLETGNFKLKPILGIADPAPFFSPAMLKLVRWIADYTCSPIELCLKAAVPAAVLKPNAKPKELLFVEACVADGTAPVPPEMRTLRHVCAIMGGPTSVSAKFCN